MNNEEKILEMPGQMQSQMTQMQSDITDLKKGQHQKMNVNENRCSRGFLPEKCLTAKCYTYNYYSSQKLPCFYYKDGNCGFDGKLQNIKGEKLRRRYFTILLLLQGLGLYIVYAMLIVNTLINGIGAKFDSFNSFLEPLRIFAILMLPFLILSFLNTHFFGKCTCVLNENGIYSNQHFIKWADIKSIEYFAVLPTRTINCCYVKVSGKNIEILLPHVPFVLLLKSKKYNKSIKTFYSKNSKYLFAFSVFLPLVITLLIFLYQTKY